MFYKFEDYQKTLSSVQKLGRRIDYLLIKNIKTPCLSEIEEELLKFQNPDGGFGHALEPDLRLPDSSAIATEIAIKIINYTGLKSPTLVQSILNYLYETYDKDRHFWPITPPQVDDYPRAVWWNYEGYLGFGKYNPTATLLAFIKRYDKNPPIDLKWHENDILDYMNKTPIEAFDAHEIFCLENYFEEYQDLAGKVRDKLDQAIEHIIEKDSSKWGSYVPEPIKYITRPSHALYLKYDDLMEKNLDYTIDSMDDNATWPTKHVWYQFDDIFEQTAKQEWVGFFTFENILRLIRFNRTEGL